MDCTKAELYMDVLLNSELPVQDNLEVVDHIESCNPCKTKYELSEETRSKIKHYIGSIKASEKLRKKIHKNLNKEQNKVTYLKPLLLAASVAFLIGIGIFFNQPSGGMPTLNELHHQTNIKFVSSDVNLLSDHIKVDIKKLHLANFEAAKYKIIGATKIKRLFKKDINLIALENNTGDKISICFLPENFNETGCHELKIGNYTFLCGYGENCQFAYWKNPGKTIAVVSNDLSHEEMIKLAMPLTET